ncbi:MAG: glycosyltransferase family 2 protein [Pirellulales bacterium]
MDSRLVSQQTAELVSISVVIPCFNESESVGQLKERLANLLEVSSQRASSIQWQFIMVDDGSSDSTYQDLLAAFKDWPQVQVFQHPQNRGLIAALQTGFAACQTPWVAVIDSDCTYEPLLLIDLMQKALETPLDCVTCSPYHPEGSVGNVPAWRIWLSRCASLLYRWPMRNKLTCYTCCVRVYRSELVKNCKIVSCGFVGVTELLWRVDQAGANIGEIPATLRPRTTGVSKMRTLRTTIQHFKLLGAIAKEKLFG